MLCSAATISETISGQDIKAHAQYQHVNDTPIWQRDALAIEMDSKIKVEQKIDYIHVNPLHEKWNLATKPEEYAWSSENIMKKVKMHLVSCLIMLIDFKMKRINLVEQWVFCVPQTTEKVMLLDIMQEKQQQ